MGQWQLASKDSRQQPAILDRPLQHLTWAGLGLIERGRSVPVPVLGLVFKRVSSFCFALLEGMSLSFHRRSLAVLLDEST